jgi:phosphohistidine phosphatase
MGSLTLLVMRHGKSDWSPQVGDGTDRNRPLNGRGRKAAKLMGDTLTTLDQVPDLVITSPARRARRTADLAGKAGRWNAPVAERDALYHGSPADLVALLRDEGGASGRVLIVGHEPMCSEVVQVLTGARVAFPTAAVAAVTVAVRRWSELAAGTGELAWLLPPRVVGALPPQAQPAP